MQPFIVFGASNAAGWSEIHSVDYNISNLLGLLYVQSGFFKIAEDSAILDLSSEPELEERSPVLNKGFPGDTVLDLERRIKEDVIDEKPSSVFLWSGLNDITIATSLLYGEKTEDDFNGELFAAISRENPVDSLAETIYGYIGRMNDLLVKNGCKTYIGTIPPFSSALKMHLSTPIGSAFFSKGSDLIKKVNGKILETKNATIVDAYAAVVDPESGLMRSEFSYGAPKERSGDILHLNDNGQLAVAGVLFQAILGKPVRIIAPGGSELVYNKP